MLNAKFVKFFMSHVKSVKLCMMCENGSLFLSDVSCVRVSMMYANIVRGFTLDNVLVRFFLLHGNRHVKLCRVLSVMCRFQKVFYVACNFSLFLHVVCKLCEIFHATCNFYLFFHLVCKLLIFSCRS